MKITPLAWALAALLPASSGCWPAKTTTYQFGGSERYARECGFAFACEIYGDHFSVWNLTQDEDTAIYGRIHGLRCDTTPVVESMEAEFSDTHVSLTLNGRHAHYFNFECPDLKRETRKNTGLILRITTLRGSIRSTKEYLFSKSVHHYVNTIKLTC